jgi:hypothetical protein
VTQVGWFGVGVAMFALPVAQMFPALPRIPLLAVSGACMTLTAYYGIKSLTILSIIAVPAIALLGSASMAKAFHDFGGIAAWFGMDPANPISLAAAIGICVASFISGGTLTPDFTRYARTPRIAVSATVIAFLLGNSLMFLFGAVASAFYQTNDISLALKAQGLIAVSVLVLGLNIWTTNDNALYAASLGFATLARRTKRQFVLINGFLGTVFATAAYNHFVPWLNLLNLMLPSIGAILILDHFVVRRRAPEAPAPPRPLGRRRRLGRRISARRSSCRASPRSTRCSPPRPPISSSPAAHSPSTWKAISSSRATCLFARRLAMPSRRGVRAAAGMIARTSRNTRSGSAGGRFAIAHLADGLQGGGGHLQPPPGGAGLAQRRAVGHVQPRRRRRADPRGTSRRRPSPAPARAPAAAAVRSAAGRPAPACARPAGPACPPASAYRPAGAGSEGHRPVQRPAA